MVTFEPILESPTVLSWTVLALVFIFVGGYMRGISHRRYPRPAWLAYIVIGHGLLLGVTFRHEFNAAHQFWANTFLLASAIFFGAVFYWMATKYADSISNLSDELRSEKRGNDG